MKTEWLVAMIGLCIFIGGIGVGGTIEASRAKDADYKRGYSHGFAAGEKETMRLLAVQAMKDEIRRQTQNEKNFKAGMLPTIKGMPTFEVNR